jgi:hypothetical protein
MRARSQWAMHVFCLFSASPTSSLSHTASRSSTSGFVSQAFPKAACRLPWASVHFQVPAQTGRELYGAQIFVNLRSTNKLAPPRTLWLENSEVPEWRSDAGDRVRVVVGSYEGLASPLVPAEPFNLLDVALRHEISFNVQTGHYALVYVREGRVVVRAEGREQRVPSEHALALHGDGGRVAFEAVHDTIELAHWAYGEVLPRYARHNVRRHCLSFGIRRVGKRSRRFIWALPLEPRNH